MTASDESPASSLHGWLVQHGPALVVWVGLVLIALGVGLDRDPLAGFGLVAVILGVVLPRVRGQLEATLAGVKVGEIIDPSELRARIQAKGKNLPREAVERAEEQATDLYISWQSAREASNWPAMRPFWDALGDALAEGVLSESARHEWLVGFEGLLTDEARAALDRADDLTLASETVAGWEGPGGGLEDQTTPKYRVLALAPTATEAVNRVRFVLANHGEFTNWEVDPLRPRPPGNDD